MNDQFSVKVPERPRLRLVTCAEREPLAPGDKTPPLDGKTAHDPLPSQGHATIGAAAEPVASRSADLTAICGEDIVDLAYLSALLLPRLKQAVSELEHATEQHDPVETITACRRILACALTAKPRADALERRLP